MSNVLDITPALKTEWTALIQVLEVGHIQENIGREELRHLLFTDCKVHATFFSQSTFQYSFLTCGNYHLKHGTKVLAIIYGYHLPLFKHTFKPYKRYYISNAVITKVQTQFVINSYKYSWSLNNRTLVQPYPELQPPVLPCHFQFTPFTQLHRHAETDNYQSKKNFQNSKIYYIYFPFIRDEISFFKSTSGEGSKDIPLPIILMEVNPIMMPNRRSTSLHHFF